MATTAPVLNESAPAAEYARLEERIIARDQKGASDVLYRLMKQGRPVTEITRETVRIHAPYTHVPYHQRLDDGVVKFVNNDHCLLSERVGLPLRSMIRPELAWLPMAQTVWYMPTGLDPWNQLIGKAPGHYTRLYDIKVNATPPMPERHWPDQAPVQVEGSLRERLNHWLTLVQRGEVLAVVPRVSRIDAGRAEPAARPGPAGVRRAHRRAGPDAGTTARTRPATRGTGPAPPSSSATRSAGTSAHDVLYAGVPDIAVGPRWYSTYEMGCNVVQNLLDGRDAELLRQDTPLTPAEEAMLVDVITRQREFSVIDAVVALLKAGPERAAHPRRHPDRRRAGDSRNGRAEQLLDGAARLRVLQHGRLVLRHLRPSASAEAALRGRALHQSRRRAPGQHAGQRPPRDRAAARAPSAGRRARSSSKLERALLALRADEIGRPDRRVS